MPSKKLIIPSNNQPWKSQLWKAEMRGAFHNSKSLLEFLKLPYSKKFEDNGFSTLVTKTFARRMESSYEDPLLKQVLPDPKEQDSHPDFVADPLNEFSDLSQNSSNILQKYNKRALLITSNACAINCRYCFRRHFPYKLHRPKTVEQAIKEIGLDTSINELILSGGDPLLLDDKNLDRIFQEIEAIKTIKTIRIHTRLPIVLPQRISEGFLDALNRINKKLVIVVHTNHSNELNDETQRAFNYLKKSGAFLLNQSVLLKGINDNAETLIDLSNKLFDQSVLPYYLHLPDKVANTAHFFIDTTQALAIHKKMQANLSGYLLPNLVREIPGQPSKTIIST